MLSVVLVVLGSLEQLPPEDARLAPRVRAQVGFAVGGGLGFATNAYALAPGFDGQIGVTFADRFSVSAHLLLATWLMMTSVEASARFEVALSDHVQLGVGFGWGLFALAEGPGAAFLGTPIRLQYSFRERGVAERGRKGLALFLDVTPGYSFASSFGLPRPGQPAMGPPITVTGAVGISYAWW